jgi:type II secretory pathway predicted ATPase ExeA
MAYMHYGLTQGEGFVLVTGAPGTGKTMLVKSLIKNLNKDKLLIGLMMTSQVGPEDVLRMIASTFGFQYFQNDKASLLASFEKFIIEKAKEGKSLLLIVDEAQNLPRQSLEELRMLTNLDVDGKPVFQVFLVGQSELKRTIHAADMEQLKQRIVSSFHLDPLDVEETKSYILFRLQTAGWKAKPEFADGVFSIIHDFTAGIPRRINSLCDRVLLFGYLEELSVLNEQAIAKVIAEVKEELLLEDSADALAAAAVVNSTHIEHYSDEESRRLENRILSLENSLHKLQVSFDKERALLRKAILLNLDMDPIYSQNSEVGSQK